MSPRKIKTGVFILEGLNSFAVTCYFYYFYFFTAHEFGFGNKANLALAAFSGLIYVPAAIFGGRFAQRAGYFTALKLGFAIMIAALTVGWLFVDSAAGQIVIMAITTIGMCFTWPTLEAMVSEGETPTRLQRNVGIYNVVWAATGAVAYFIGGAMLEKLGMAAMFYVPIAVQVLQLAITVWLEVNSHNASAMENLETASTVPIEPNPRPIAKAKSFLRMAWLANPFAYIAINTLIAVMPGIAKRLELTPMFAGFCCSVWCFVRLGAFFVLWFWSGWHYRFRWLIASYIGLVGTFAVIMTTSSLAVLVLAQILFGVATGLIYYSSLYYSMDVGEAKGDHAGIHEAALGFGNFAGPAVGAASLYFLPQYANGGVVAVSGLLLCGLVGIVWLRARK